MWALDGVLAHWMFPLNLVATQGNFNQRKVVHCPLMHATAPCLLHLYAFHNLSQSQVYRRREYARQVIGSKLSKSDAKGPSGVACKGV